MASFKTLSREKPKIIAHRGASGYLPEHTLGAYTLAIDLGCDFIEPDLVFTKDGELVVRHDIYLSDSTDVRDHDEFLTRRRTHKLHGKPDWFVEDFTLEELKTLRCRQAFPGRSKDYDGLFEILTFDELLAFAQKKSAEKGRKLGVYPETKKPDYYKKIGFDFVGPLLTYLKKYDYHEPDGSVYLQSFEPRILMRLAKKTKLPLIFLLEDKFKFAFLMKVIARYVQGIGPSKSLLVRDKKSTGLLEKAHRVGLEVHPWTFRNDQVGPGFATPEEELGFFINLGVDAFFTDFTDTGKCVREKLS
jgi:glycerophosphoryl diester phosphodiesterase